MNDKELADAVVALGVGDSFYDEETEFNYRPPTAITLWLSSEKFVTDWRVAGALMEKCSAIDIDTIGNPWWIAAYEMKFKDGNKLPEKWFKAQGDSLPHAIIEACVGALS